jgi:hypothetical protein
VLAILDRPGILSRRDGIGVADFALAVVDANFAPAGALDDLLSALLGWRTGRWLAWSWAP